MWTCPAVDDMTCGWTATAPTACVHCLRTVFAPALPLCTVLIPAAALCCVLSETLPSGRLGSSFQLLTCQASLEVTYLYHIRALLDMALYFFVLWDKLDESSSGLRGNVPVAQRTCRINPSNNEIRQGENRIGSSFWVPFFLSFFLCIFLYSIRAGIHDQSVTGSYFKLLQKCINMLLR